MSVTFSNLTDKKQPLDLKLNEEIFFNKENGFFIELGAYDGLVQSNTAFFEFSKKWNGILIEPSRERYVDCVNNRPNSKCFNTACSNKNTTQISLDHENGLMSKVVENGDYVCNTVTLETILDECSIDHNIDFLSLDVEGHELEVLDGLNLNKYRPNYMLVELWNSNRDDVITFLKMYNYEFVSNYTNYNHLDNPTWSGLHNDFLFKDRLIT